MIFDRVSGYAQQPGFAPYDYPPRGDNPAIRPENFITYLTLTETYSLTGCTSNGSYAFTGTDNWLKGANLGGFESEPGEPPVIIGERYTWSYANGKYFSGYSWTSIEPVEGDFTATQLKYKSGTDLDGDDDHNDGFTHTFTHLTTLSNPYTFSSFASEFPSWVTTSFAASLPAGRKTWAGQTTFEPMIVPYETFREMTLSHLLHSTYDYYFWGDYYWDNFYFYSWPSTGYVGNPPDLSYSKLQFKYIWNPSTPLEQRYKLLRPLPPVFQPQDDSRTGTSAMPLDESQTITPLTGDYTWSSGDTSAVSSAYTVAMGTSSASAGRLGRVLSSPFRLDIDSLNRLDFASPSGTQAEREAIGQLGNNSKPGKVILVNDKDADHDGIPDYVDGYDLYSTIDEDDHCYNSHFVPIRVRIPSAASGATLIRFIYSASDPENITENSAELYLLPSTGKLRLWKQKASSSRDGRDVREAGDFLKSGQTYSLSELGWTQSAPSIELYLEAVKESTAVADEEITAQLILSSGSTLSDSVRVTSVRVELTGRGLFDDSHSQVAGFQKSRVRLEPYQDSVTLNEVLSTTDLGSAKGDVSHTGSSASMTTYQSATFAPGDEGTYGFFITGAEFDIKADIGFGPNSSSAQWAGGLMVRSSLESGDAFFCISFTPQGQVILRKRVYTAGGALQISSTQGVAVGNKLRLKKIGSQITAYCSATGSSWTTIGSVTSSEMGTDDIYVGIHGLSTDTSAQSNIGFSGLDLPLEGFLLRISDSMTPGSLLVQRVNIFDPRTAGLTTVSIDGESIPITRQSGAWRTAEFYVTLPGEREDIEGLPSLRIESGASTFNCQYNPFWSNSSPSSVIQTPIGYGVVGTTVSDIVTTMKNTGWSGAPNNPGAFGAEVHLRASQQLRNVDGFLVDVYVKNGTNEILSIGKNLGNKANTTQVDILHVTTDYKPKVGEILDQTKVIDLYDIKGSLNGGLGASQKTRLRAVVGGRSIHIAKTEYRWTPAKGWELNRSWRFGFRLLAAFGAASAGHAIFNRDDYDDQLVALYTQAQNCLGVQDYALRVSMMIDLQQQLRNYLANFLPDSTPLDIINLKQIYKIIGDGYN